MKKQHELGLLVFCLSAGLSLVAASPAAAQGGFSNGSGAGHDFGAQGQLVITGAFEAHLHNGWELRLHPALDYFIAPNISVGGVVGITYHSGTPSTTVFELGARAGYHLAIADRLEFWPTVGIFFSHTRVSTSPPQNGSSTSLGILAPFLYDVAPHLFVGAGPSFNLALDGGGNGYGLDSVVGGWF